MLPGGGGIGVAEHPGDLRDAILAVDLLHVAGGQAAARRLGDYEVPAGPRGDLRQVGDHQHLTPLRDLRQRRPDLRADLAPDPRIDLVEHQGRHPVLPGEHHLERQHEARELAAGGGACQWPRLHPRIEPHHEGHGLLPLHLHPAQRRQLHLQLPARQAQLRQQPGDPARQAPRGILPLARQLVRRRMRRTFGRDPPGAELPQVEVGGVEQVQFARRLRAGGEHRVEARAVLLLEPVDQVPAALHLRQSRRILLEAVGIALGQAGQFAERGVGPIEQLPPRSH